MEQEEEECLHSEAECEIHPGIRGAKAARNGENRSFRADRSRSGSATISAKRHRIEQIVLNGLTVYSFEGIIQNRYGPMAQLVRAPPCHGGGRGFESHSGRLYRIFSI